MKRLLLLFLFATTLAFANEQQDLEKIVNNWAPKLGLTNWTIEVTIVPYEDLLLQLQRPVLGASTWDVPTKTGKIWVCSRDSYSPALLKDEHVTNIKLDQENTVVHEMIHNLMEHADEEWAVQLLSEQIVPEHKISGINRIMRTFHNIFASPAAPAKGQ